MMENKIDDLVIISRREDSVAYPHGKVGRITMINKEKEVIQVRCGTKVSNEDSVVFSVAPASRNKGELRVEPLNSVLAALLAQTKLDEVFFPPSKIISITA